MTSHSRDHASKHAESGEDDIHSHIHHGGIQGLADDDHTQYLKADGTREMSGDLDMGTHAITDVGNVDGVDVGSHVHTGAGANGPKLDHGTALNGLGDDDHTQYVKADGTRAFSGVVEGVTPTGSTHLATKGYVDGLVQGVDWQDSVIDKDLTAPPAEPVTGDRYIVGASATGAWAGHDDDIAEWSGSAWVFTSVEEGMCTWVEDEDIVYIYNGSAWVKMASVTTHNNLSGLQGGQASQYYHLTSAEHTDLTDGNDCAEHKHDQMYFTETEHIDSSAGAGDAGKPIKLDVAGHVDATMINDADISHANLGGVTSDQHHAQLHAAAHQNGGGDEISVAGLSGELADNQPPKAHSTSHKNGGSDEVAVAAAAANAIPKAGAGGKLASGWISEVLAYADLTDDPYADHSARHENGGADEISVAGLSGELADGQPPKDHTHQSAGSGVGGKLDHGLALNGLADDDHTQYHTDTRGDARYYQKSEFKASSAGAGDAGKPVKLDATGFLDNTMVQEIYFLAQAAEPTVTANQVCIWTDTDDSNRVWFIFGTSGGNVKVEMT